MAIKSKDEILSSIRSKFGDDTGDDVISIIEDISDTFTDYETRIESSDAKIWENKYNENDRMWREKYTSRFFSGGGESSEDIDDKPADNEVEDNSPKTFDELFKKEG